MSKTIRHVNSHHNQIHNLTGNSNTKSVHETSSNNKCDSNSNSKSNNNYNNNNIVIVIVIVM